MSCRIFYAGSHRRCISTVYGHATIDITDSRTRELVALLATEGANIPKVYLGSDHANTTNECLLLAQSRCRRQSGNTGTLVQW